MIFPPHDSEAFLADLCSLVGRPYSLGEVTIEGRDPVLPSDYLLGTAGTVVIAAAGLAAADLWHLRTGRRQKVSVDLRTAGAAVRSGRYLNINGELSSREWNELSRFYRTSDERWLQLHCNFPHYRDVVLSFLRCGNDRSEVMKAVGTWEGQRLEDRLTDAGACVGLVRSGEEWQRHAHAQAVAKLPLLEVK